MTRPDTSSSSSSRARDVFQKFRSNTHHSRYRREEGCESFWTEVYPRQKQVVVAYTTEAFAQLGCAVDEIGIGQIQPRPIGILPKHGMLLGALYDILINGGLLERRGDGSLARTSQALDTTPSTAIHESLLSDFPLYGVSHQLLHVTGSRLAACLRGDEDPMKLIFGLNRKLVQDFYTDAPMFKAASRLLSDYLRECFDRFRDGAVVELLEVGAGLGGTTAYVLAMLAQLGVPFRYVYTDISASLVAAAKKRFSPLVPAGSSMEFVVLDVTKPIAGNRISKYDAVISTNCVHATENLTISTGNIRQMLRPGGFLALIELMPRLYWFDLVFGFFEGWWMFNDGRQHCLADLDFWQDSLIKAGFEEVAWLDEDEGRSRTVGRVDPQLIVAFT